MNLYYYDKKGNEIGPITQEELLRLAKNGVIHPETRITDGTDRSISAKRIPNIQFYAPEYYRAEEIFNPDNYTTKAPNPKENQEIDNEPITVPSTKRNAAVKKQYPYFRITTTLFYTIANFIYYGGITLTVLFSLAATTKSVLAGIGILTGGLLITFIYMMMFGLIADTTQWLLNTEQHLKEIKNQKRG